MPGPECGHLGLSSGSEREPDKAHFLICCGRQRRLHKKLDGWGWLSPISGLKHDHLRGLGRAQVAEEAMDVPGSFREEAATPVNSRRIRLHLALDLPLQDIGEERPGVSVSRPTAPRNRRSRRHRNTAYTDGRYEIR